MKKLREILDRVAPSFEKGGPLEKFFPLYELLDTGAFTPGHTTRTASHVRDGLDMKRMMISVVVGLLPLLAIAMYNTGYQANFAISHGAQPLNDWHTILYTSLGGRFEVASTLSNWLVGALYYLPILAVTFAVGGMIEAVAAVIRREDVNEGFLVTARLIPLTLPPTIPLWQVGLGTGFGILIGKEVFGGTGMNFLNPALVARAFLFFAYPANLSGTEPWIAADFIDVDSFSGATWLSRAAVEPGVLDQLDWWQAFVGWIPGSMGETSALACLVGGIFICVIGVASWRTIAGVTLGTFAMATFFNWAGSDTNPMFAVPFTWHIVLGGWALGTVYMTTDPVSSSYTDTGRWIYGFLIGVLTVLIRSINPAYPEGIMLAILFMNMFAPLIDYFFLQANIRRRVARDAA
ncbi:MAG: NADH:ubiquinone reductase (Na(+)-transporting) subunit B [Myxococcota bacterium]